MRIYLTGFMGAGKTAVGRPLAERLEVPFVDLDGEIERRAGASVPEIFAQQGEVAFRDLESTALRETARQPSAVVATGGGVVESPENRAWMREQGVRIWLKPSFGTLLRRLETGEGAAREGRPLFRDPAAAEALYARRLPAYGECEIELEVTDDEAVGETVERIIQSLGEKACAT